MPDSQPVYEKRLTFFVDFLGFREHVERSVTEPEFLARLIRAMDRVGEIVEEDVRIRHSQKITQFSDCLVISYTVAERSAVFWLLNSIAICVIDLVERGFLLRGAVTYGDLLHTDKHVVGPALVKAYELESRIANNPRILIDESLVGIAKSAHSFTHDADHEEEYVRNFMTKDEDGLFFFDYFTARSVVGIVGAEPYSYPGYLREIAELVRRGLGHEDYRVAKKYLWVYQKYADAVDQLLSDSVDHPARLESPEIYWDVEALPKLCVEAKATAVRVAAGEAAKASKAG